MHKKHSARKPIRYVGLLVKEQGLEITRRVRLVSETHESGGVVVCQPGEPVKKAVVVAKDRIVSWPPKPRRGNEPVVAQVEGESLILTGDDAEFYRAALVYCAAKQRVHDCNAEVVRLSTLPGQPPNPGFDAAWKAACVASGEIMRADFALGAAYRATLPRPAPKDYKPKTSAQRQAEWDATFESDEEP